MRSPIHLELTPRDLISTATPAKKPCPVNTSCDHLPHLEHSSTSLEPQDHSIVGSTETESILESEDLLQLDSISVSSQAVEKPQFPIVFNFSCAFLKSKTTCLHVSFTAYEYLYKLSKGASFSRWLLHPVT